MSQDKSSTPDKDGQDVKEETPDTPEVNDTQPEIHITEVQPLDPQNMSVGLAADDGTVTEATIIPAGDIPEELRDDRPDSLNEPKTGLVAEFHDLTFNQGAFLVSSRESSAVSRSATFYLTTLIIGLAVIAGLVFGVVQAKQQVSGTGSGTIATVGMAAQAQSIEQQTGLKVLDTNSPDEAQQAVRDGRADAAFISDPTGLSQPQIIALDKKPIGVLAGLSPPPNITYLETPAVNFQVAQPVAIGLSGLMIAAALTLAFALYANLRVEKRHRIAEIIAATIPAKASALGRVQGLTLLSLVHLVVAVALLLLGLSITQYASVAIALLPALAWFALLYLLTVFATLALFLWASNIVGRRVRQICLGVVCALVIVGSFLPLIFATNSAIVRILIYIPFTSPVATALHFMGSQAHWWDGLVAAAITLVFALIVMAIAASAYRANLLRGSGRETLSAKQRKKLKERATKDVSSSTASKDDSASEGNESAQGVSPDASDSPSDSQAEPEDGDAQSSDGEDSVGEEKEEDDTDLGEGEKASKTKASKKTS